MWQFQGVQIKVLIRNVGNKQQMFEYFQTPRLLKIHLSTLIVVLQHRLSGLKKSVPTYLDQYTSSTQAPKTGSH